MRELNKLLARHHVVEGSSANREGCRDGEPVGEEETSRNVLADVNKSSDKRPRDENGSNSVWARCQPQCESGSGISVAAVERDALRREIESLEDRVAGLLCPRPATSWPLPCPPGRSCMSAAGRIKSAIEGAGRAHRARFLHHDGGIEHSSSLLPGLISRADVLLFPIDCISHDAVATLKRLCRQLEKPYLPLRTASLATLASSLAGMARNPTA